MRAFQLGQHVGYVAHGEREQHLPARQPQTVHAGREAVPVRLQFIQQRLQFFMRRSAAAHVGKGGHRGFAGAVQQARGALRALLLPGVPGGQKVQPQPKAKLQHAPARGASPRGRFITLGKQAAAAQKDVLRLAQPIGAAVDVAKTGGKRHTVRAPLNNAHWGF